MLIFVKEIKRTKRVADKNMKIILYICKYYVVKKIIYYADYVLCATFK